jgi:hypothetical protein
MIGKLREVEARTRTVIVIHERMLGVEAFSSPQISVGAAVANLRVF